MTKIEELKALRAAAYTALIDAFKAHEYVREAHMAAVKEYDAAYLARKAELKKQEETKDA